MKILYAMGGSLAHQRILESFDEIPGVEQLVVGPKEKKGLINNYGYKDFKIKNIITFDSQKETSKIIKDINPDIYCDSVFSFVKNNFVFNYLPKNCKTVFIGHGFANHDSLYVANVLYKKQEFIKKMNTLSLACGCTQYFVDLMNGFYKVDKNKIVLNALPQIDMLFDKKYYESRRGLVLNRLGYNQEIKTILYFGNLSSKSLLRSDFLEINNTFFETLFYLYDFVCKNNMLLLVKTKTEPNKIIDFCKNHANIGLKTLDKFSNILNSKNNIHFISSEGHAYQYYFSDLVIINGNSSVEIECSLINKPFIFINPKNPKLALDSFGTIKNKAAVEVLGTNNFDRCIFRLLQDDSFRKELFLNQKKHIDRLGVVFDGKAHKRAQEKIIGLLK